MLETINLSHRLRRIQLLAEDPKEFLLKCPSQETNSFDFELLESDRIFGLDSIKKICVDYRLRFLDVRLFKGQVPNEALQKIEQLEQMHNTQIDHLKIMAPSKLFKLENADDPLLFVPIGNNHFYLIHQWGNDLHPLRKALVWPFKNIINLTVSILVLSFLISAVMPLNLFVREASYGDFFLIFLFMFKSVAAIVIYYFFASGKNFNQAIWDSKYYN